MVHHNAEATECERYHYVCKIMGMIGKDRKGEKETSKKMTDWNRNIRRDELSETYATWYCGRWLNNGNQQNNLSKYHWKILHICQMYSNEMWYGLKIQLCKKNHSIVQIFADQKNIRRLNMLKSLWMWTGDFIVTLSWSTCWFDSKRWNAEPHWTLIGIQWITSWRASHVCSQMLMSFIVSDDLVALKSVHTAIRARN